MMFNEHGPINHILGLITGEVIEYSWLSEPNYALVPIMIAEIWQWSPLMFLLILTGMMNLPENQVRAAISLGASRVRIFFRIMLPLLMPVMAVALLIRSIETFKIFDAVYILTRGGPGASTETISMFMYNGAFVYFRFGYIAAAAFIVLFVVLAICIALARPLKRHG
jgi:multiple sugar transport system permease protein